MFLQVALTIIGVFLSVVLTKLLIQNGSAIERGFKKMDEGFRKMDMRTKEIADLIVQEGKLIREVTKGK